MPATPSSDDLRRGRLANARDAAAEALHRYGGRTGARAASALVPAESTSGRPEHAAAAALLRVAARALDAIAAAPEGDPGVGFEREVHRACTRAAEELLDAAPSGR